MLEERRLYYKLTNDISYLPEFLEYFENESVIAKNSLVMTGSIEKISKDIPYEMDKRFTQLQILNAAIEYFEKQLDQLRAKYHRKYLENYQRALSTRDVEKYTNGEPEVVDMALIINEIAIMRNIFISITKSIDAKSFQVNNITRLRVAGLDDAKID